MFLRILWKYNETFGNKVWIPESAKENFYQISRTKGEKIGNFAVFKRKTEHTSLENIFRTNLNFGDRS